MEIEFNDLQIKEIRDEVNLILWNNNYSTENMQFTNELLEELKKVKIKIN